MTDAERQRLNDTVLLAHIRDRWKACKDPRVRAIILPAYERDVGSLLALVERLQEEVARLEAQIDDEDALRMDGSQD